MELRQITAGVVLGFMVAACAGATFPYKFYGIAASSFAGTLQGPTPSDDLEFSVCAPTATSQDGCVAMLQSDFFAMKQDYQNTKNQLIACQHGK